MLCLWYSVTKAKMSIIQTIELCFVNWGWCLMTHLAILSLQLWLCYINDYDYATLCYPTYFARSKVANLELQWKLQDCSWMHWSTACECVPKCTTFTNFLSLQFEMFSYPTVGVSPSGVLEIGPVNSMPILVPVTSPLTCMVYLGPFWSYL